MLPMWARRPQEQKSATKKKSERGGFNCLNSDTECEKDEYAFKVEIKAQETVLRVLICNLGVWLLKVYSLTRDLLVILWIRRREELKSKGIKNASQRGQSRNYTLMDRWNH